MCTFAPLGQPRLALTSNDSTALCSPVAAARGWPSDGLLTSAMHWPVLETIWYDAASSAIVAACFLRVQFCWGEPSQDSSSAPPPNRIWKQREVFQTEAIVDAFSSTTHAMLEQHWNRARDPSEILLEIKL